MSEETLQQALNEAREAKEKAIEAFQYAEKTESNILHQMEIHHLTIANRVDDVSNDVKIHRTIISTIAGVIGLAVLGALLKGIGL
jgi:hypothetical protein